MIWPAGNFAELLDSSDRPAGRYSFKGGETKISFAAPKAGKYSLQVVDAAGRLLYRDYAHHVLTAGQTINFDLSGIVELDMPEIYSKSTDHKHTTVHNHEPQRYLGPPLTDAEAEMLESYVSFKTVPFDGLWSQDQRDQWTSVQRLVARGLLKTEQDHAKSRHNVWTTMQGQAALRHYQSFNEARLRERARPTPPNRYLEEALF